MAAAAGVSRTWVFGVFSASLLVSAFLGPVVGRMIDRHGGSGLLSASNVVFGGGTPRALRLQWDGIGLVSAWGLLGIGNGARLVRRRVRYLDRTVRYPSRAPITGITLIAGFASTVGWPLSAFLDAQNGWRYTCVVWAVMHIVIGLPLNLLLVPRGKYHADHKQQSLASWEPRKEMVLLAYVFAASWFVTGAMAAHLPALLEGMGASATQAVAASALVGPAQVAARLAEFVIMRRAHPLVSARIAASMHPAGAALLLVIGAPAAPLFALLHGAGNGLLTIARGTVPLALFGPEGYGARTGLLGAPARAAQAAAPLLFGLLLDQMGRGALFVSGGLCLSALAALLLIKAPIPQRDKDPL